MSYEYFFSPKWYKNFSLVDASRYLLTQDPDVSEIYTEGDISHNHYYVLTNVMFDIFERMTIGLELDYGLK